MSASQTSPVPPAGTSSRVDRVLRELLRGASVALALALGISLLMPAFVRLPEWVWVAPPALAAFVGLVAGLALAGRALCGNIRARLGEALATLGLGATVLAILQKALHVQGKANIPGAIALAVFVFGLLGLGSIWGWSAARRLEEERAGPRFRLLLYGWLLIPGTLSLVVFGLLLVVMTMGGPGRELPLALISMLGGLLCLPAREIERRIRRLVALTPRKGPPR